jgi:G3E family GTPase
VSEKPNVLVLSGFLGSGKTTLLLRLVEHLRAKYGSDYRIAIIENEIGSASVDSGIIEEAGYSVTEMLSGCVCCTLIGQLVPAIKKLTEELEPQLIILEATGMATPSTMCENIEQYAGCPVRIASLVDASRWERILRALRILLEQQVECADIICVNKCDLADEAQLAEVERTVREMNAEAPIVYASAHSPMNAADLDAIAGE